MDTHKNITLKWKNGANSKFVYSSLLLVIVAGGGVLASATLNNVATPNTECSEY